MQAQSCLSEKVNRDNPKVNQVGEVNPLKTFTKTALTPRYLGASAACSRLEPCPLVFSANDESAALLLGTFSKSSIHWAEGVLANFGNVASQRHNFATAWQDVVGGDVVARFQQHFARKLCLQRLEGGQGFYVGFP